MNEAQLLLLTAAAIAFLHTVLGADHYVVFTAMGKAHGWRLAKTLRVTRETAPIKQDENKKSESDRRKPARKQKRWAKFYANGR